MCNSCPSLRRSSSFLPPSLGEKYVVQEHAFPESSVFDSELFGYLKTEAEIQDDKLMFSLVLRVGTYEYVAWMRIAVNKPRHENLLSEGPNEIMHDLFLAEVMRIHLLIISDLEPIDPLRDHDSFRSVLRVNSRNIQLLSFFIALDVLNC